MPDAPPKIVGLIEKRLEQCLGFKQSRLEEASAILLAYAGFSIDKARAYVKARSNSTLPKWFDDKVTLNALQPIARTIAATLTSNEPSWLVEPVGVSVSQQRAARGVQRLLDYFYRTNDIPGQLDDVVLNACLTGFAGFYVDWDTEVDAGKMDDTDIGRKGWFVTEPVDIFSIHFEPGVGGLENAHWCIRETTMHLDEARKYFNNGDIQPEKRTRDHSSTVNRHLRLVHDTEDARRSVDTDEDNARIRVLHYWQKPGDSYPEGLEMIIAGDTVVSVVPRLLMGEFPIYTMRFICEPWRDYGSGLGSALLHMQRDLSMTWNSYRARRDLETRPPWLVPGGSMKEPMNTRPGALNHVNLQRGKPEPVRFDPLSQVVGRMGQDTLSWMEYIAGINDVAYGRSPTSDASGRVVAYLSELQGRMVGPAVRSMTRMLSNMGRRMLRLWQENGSESVAVSILGRGRVAEVAEIKRADILWHDVSVDVGSMMPRKQPMQQETVLNLMSQGFIPPEQGLEALEFGGFNEAMGIDSVETINARMENAALDDPNIDLSEISVREYEDHASHITEHRKFLLAERPPDKVQERFEKHMQVHQQHLAEEEQQKLQQAQAAQAAEGAAGGFNIAGAPAAPGGVPPEMIPMQEPGVDTDEEAALASIAGIPS